MKLHSELTFRNFYRIASNTGKKTSDVETDENDDDSDLNYWPDRKGN